MARQEPQNKDAEISVLGCGFLEKTALDKILDEVTEEMFYDEANRIILSLCPYRPIGISCICKSAGTDIEMPILSLET